MPDEHAPELIFVGGADELRLEEGGRTYRPGDALPHLGQARQNALRAAGIRLATRHYEPVVTPEGRPSPLAAAEQIEGPAVVAAVEAVPPADPTPDEPARRAPRKGSD